MADIPPPAAVLIPVDFDPFAEPTARTLELSPQQREIYAVAQLGDDANCAYNQCFALRLQGPLSPQSMLNALTQVVQRHEALRVRISNDEQQEILPAVETALPLIDLSAMDAAERGQAISELLDCETRTPFDLAKAPLWRAQLIREAADLHRLIFTAHHLVVDGWSSAVIFHDLAQVYAADRFGLQAQLPAAGSYRELIASARSSESTAEAQASEDFWVKQFAGGVPAFDLPFDRSYPPLKTYSAARQVLSIDEALYQAVRKVGAQQGATLFVTLLAAFDVLLARLSSSQELVIGVPMASQALQDNGHLVAHGVNTIPLLCRVNMQHSFIEHLRDTRRMFLEAQAHQRLTFGSLVHRLRLPRNPSRTPLVTVIFNIDKLGAPFDFGEVSVTGVETPKSFFNFEFGINAVDDGESLLLECDYNADLLDAATVTRWLGHYRELLAAIAANPSTRVAELPLLTAAERAELLGAVPGSYASDVTLHERFEQQAARTPNAVALISFGADESRRELSYAELNRLSNALAYRLRERGVRPNELVALRTERTVDVVIGILAILKAGAAYLPLDPVYPHERIAFMIQDAQVRIVLTHSALQADLAGIAVTVVCLDEPLPTDARQENLPALSGAQDLAYVIYTSGSTGKPKAVRITHRNVMRLFAATEQWFGFNERDVWTLFHSYAFDFSVWELWGALLYGGRVVVVSMDTSRNTEAFRELLLREAVTVLNQTPTAFRQLIDIDRAVPPGAFALRYVIFGGEALELHSLKPWFDRYGEHRPRLINMYGITETTVHVTYRPITSADLTAHTGSVIGVPIPDLRVYVLDQHGQLCPLGVPGEMHVAGAGVALGYLNRPELSAQRFVPDPFSDAPETRMYRSGDLARRLPDGELEYLGRIDQQVKIRGFRIELGEIEAVIAQHPAVRQVAVIDRQDAPGEKRLVAYIITDQPHNRLIEELRQRLQRTLPDYMTPAHFIFVNALQLTHNGKLDRAALPAPEAATNERSAPIAPRTATESLVVGVFAEALNRRDIGIRDNFFELGGHSLMAARVMAKLRGATNTDLPLRNLFERPTPESLATAIDALTWAASGKPVRTDEGGHREEIEL